MQAVLVMVNPKDKKANLPKPSAPESFEAKTVATRKSLLAKHKSAYFGSLKDEDRALAASCSQKL